MVDCERGLAGARCLLRCILEEAPRKTAPQETRMFAQVQQHLLNVVTYHSSANIAPVFLPVYLSICLSMC